jgi:hypothetical protein
MVKPEQFVADAAGLSIGDTLRARADAIHHTGRGTLVTYADAKSQGLKDVSADDFWKALHAGGRWIDERDDHSPVAAFASNSLPSRPAEQADLPLAVVLHHELTPGSPLLSKLYGESNLRLEPNHVAINPACGLEDGAPAMFETLQGKCRVAVTLDAGIPPGVVQVSASPTLLDLCADGARAKVVRI